MQLNDALVVLFGCPLPFATILMEMLQIEVWLDGIPSFPSNAGLSWCHFLIAITCSQLFLKGLGFAHGIYSLN